LSKLNLYRKRFIPNELVHLENDIILKEDQDLIITKWRALKPRKDIVGGISAYYIDKGFKVSKIYDQNDNIVYWYCDIIQTKVESDKNIIVFEDLLVDVLLYEDGTLRILDLDELADAFDTKLITEDMLKDALRTLDKLLKIIDQGKFSILQDEINRAEQLYSSII